MDVRVSFYLKKSETNADGCCPVMARLTVGNHSEAAFSAKMSVPVSSWASGRATGKSAATREINRQLDELRASALAIYKEQSAIREDVTAEEVRDLLLGKAAEALTGLLNRWAVWVSAKPGAGLYFDTNYAALVCLLLIALCGLAHVWKVRLRVAVPGLLLTAALAIGAGNALCRDVVHVDLVGSANSPAVVVSQNHTAVVLFRGGASTQRAVENQLARRGVTTVELLADLRLDPENACTLPARTMCQVAVQPVGSAVTRQTQTAAVETLRTRFGCLVRLTIGEQQFVTVSGTVTLAEPVRVQWLLASPAKPEAVQWEQLLSRSDHYQWMQGGEAVYASLSLRPSGGWRAE